MSFVYFKHTQKKKGIINISIYLLYIFNYKKYFKFIKGSPYAHKTTQNNPV